MGPNNEEIKEKKPADIIEWASQPGVWAFRHDLIVSEGGPSRERVRDSSGSTLEAGEGIEVKFTLDPATVTLPEFQPEGLTALWIKGVVNCMMWIKGSQSNFLPRNCCLVQLIRGCVYGEWEGGKSGGLGLHNAGIWLVYDTNRRVGRVLRIDR